MVMVMSSRRKTSISTDSGTDRAHEHDADTDTDAGHHTEKDNDDDRDAAHDTTNKHTYDGDAATNKTNGHDSVENATEHDNDNNDVNKDNIDNKNNNNKNKHDTDDNPRGGRRPGGVEHTNFGKTSPAIRMRPMTATAPQTNPTSRHAAPRRSPPRDPQQPARRRPRAAAGHGGAPPPVGEWEMARAKTATEMCFASGVHAAMSDAVRHALYMCAPNISQSHGTESGLVPFFFLSLRS